MLRSTNESIDESAERLGQAKLDGGLPVTEISVAGKRGLEGWIIGPATVTLSPANGSPPVSRLDYSFDEGKTWQQYVGPIEVTEEGRHELRARAISTAGMLEVPAQTRLVAVDYSSPSTTDDASDFWRNQPFDVKLLGLDTASGIGATYYSTAGSDPTQTPTGRGNTVSITQEGEYALQYFSIDNAGNVEQLRMGHSLRLDMTAPTSEVEQPAVPAFVQTILLRGLAADALSGVSLVRVRFANAVTDEEAIRDAQLIGSSNWQITASLPAGAHDVTSISVDNAGNIQGFIAPPTRIYLVGVS